MPYLSAGEKIGPYEILAPLGAGGMGEVYRARDTKLKREVAIKVLPESFASDPERMARFQREAEVLASLNHPNVGAIYGVEDRALVMELIDGKSPKGPLPFDEAWGIASQIAAALEYAHEKGIIHRDLKPANILVTPDGVVKLLDFGLAKAFSNQKESSTTSQENSPTLTLGATEVGVILGTAAYMAPEQARGKTLDKRADVWSFGVVLYELLTGERLFKGEDAAETLAAVIHKPPDLAKVPPQARRLLEECMQKDPRKRLRDIGDAKRLVGENTVAPTPVSIPLFGTLPWIMAGIFALAFGISLWAPWRSAKTVDLPLVRLDVDLGPDVWLLPPVPGSSNVVISPEGTRLAYSAVKSGSATTNLFTRRLDQTTTTELTGTDGAGEPFFSPDGQWLGFAAKGKLNKISVDGGGAVTLGNIVGAGVSWGQDGSIVVGVPFTRGLLRIPAGGGPPETLAGLGPTDQGLVLPQILPGGKAILFTADHGRGVDENTIEVLTLADRHRKIVARGGQSPRYLPIASGAASVGMGYLIYLNRSTLFAVPFDLDRLETRGNAVPVLDDVAYDRNRGVGQFDFSAAPLGHGTLIYRRTSGEASEIRSVEWVYPNEGTNAKREPLRLKRGAYATPSISPDGKRIALTVNEGGGNQDVWVYDSQRDALTRLTFGGVNRSPVWSPDGQTVVFSSVGNGISQTRADGASQPQALMQGKVFPISSSFAPDGKQLAYFEGESNSQIWTVPVLDQGGQWKAGQPEQFLKSTFIDQAPSFSPDGRLLAYHSNESGRSEVYVRTFPSPPSGRSGKWLISNNGGQSPRWSRSTHQLMYQSGDQIMAATYTMKDDTFVADKPRVWIAKLGAAFAAPLANWDLAPDGTRALVVARAESEEAPKPDHEVVFLQNFFDELRRRVPLAK